MLTMYYLTLQLSNGKILKQFENGCTDLMDEYCKNQPATSTTSENVVAIEQYIHINRQITIKKLREYLTSKNGSVEWVTVILEEIFISVEQINLMHFAINVLIIND